MKLLRLNALSPDFQLPPSAVTIGNFDGVHLGHQAMIAQLKTLAEAQGLKTLVMIFEPQPLEFFKGYDAPPRISSLREKVEYLTELGVDYIAVAKFDQHFRSMNATAFADLLKNKLNAQSLVLGDDFHFGKDRQGNSEFLRKYGFDVTNLNTSLGTVVELWGNNRLVDDVAEANGTIGYELLCRMSNRPLRKVK